MKTLTLIALALTLSACGHATTTLDRELALKLADKTPVVLTQAAPTINVNNYNGNAAPQSVQQDKYAEAYANGTDTRTNCMLSPVYVNGAFSHNVRNCMGGQ